MFARHGEFDHQLSRVGADEHVGRCALPPRVGGPVLLLGETLRHVHAAQQARGGVVAGKLQTITQTLNRNQHVKKYLSSLDQKGCYFSIIVCISLTVIINDVTVLLRLLKDVLVIKTFQH